MPKGANMDMVKVSDILANVTTSVDMVDLSTPDEWFRMMALKSGDASFGRLLQAIPDKGFLDPICITKGDYGWTVGNGHHRLTAAILLGLDEIPVHFSEWYARESIAHDADLYEYPTDPDTCSMVSDSLIMDAEELYAHA